MARSAHRPRRLARRVSDARRAWSLAIGLPTVARFIRERPAAQIGHGDRAAGASVRDAMQVARLLDSRRRALLQLDRAERRDRAPLGAADRSRRCGRRGGACALGDGRREPGRAARHRLAARPLLRRASVLRAPGDGGARHVPALGRGFARDGRAGRRTHRIRDGRRGGRHSVPALTLLRAALVLGALRPHVDVLRVRRSPRSDSDGEGVRRDGIVRGAARQARARHTRRRRAHAVPAWLRHRTRGGGSSAVFDPPQA